MTSRVSAAITAAAALTLLHGAAYPSAGHGSAASNARHDDLAGRAYEFAQRLDIVGGPGLRRANAALLGTLLFILAAGLWGRRMLAHRAALGAVAIAGVTTGTHAAGRERVAVFGAGLVVLWLLRDSFSVRPDPHRYRAAVLLAGSAMVAAGAWLLSAGRWPPPGHSGHGTDGPVIGRLLALTAIGLGVVALVWVFAPGRAPSAGSPRQRERVAALVDHAEADSLAPFCTRTDRTYAFSPDARAVLGYRVLLGTAVVGGDPVGAPDAVPAAIAAFLERCRRQGWRPAVLGAGADSVAHWRAAGLTRGVAIGDEAVIDIPRFSMSTRRMRNLRQAVRRTYNAGVRVSVGSLDDALSETLRPVLDEWLRGRRERGFAMNLDGILRPRADCVVAVAYDRAGRPQAFARFATAAGGRILTLDVAPRCLGAPNGVVERLIVEVVGYGREHGAQEVSLNFAGLRTVLTATGPPARLARGLLRGFDPWVQIAPLHHFVAKFRPRWRPRWLLLRSWSEIGWVLPAVLVAEFGAGALPPTGTARRSPTFTNVRRGSTSCFRLGRGA